MSSEFLPIVMNRRISTEDSSYLRQNQHSPAKAAKVSGEFAGIIPTNDDIKAGIDKALKMIAGNRHPDRGAILNILV